MLQIWKPRNNTSEAVHQMLCSPAKQRSVSCAAEGLVQTNDVHSVHQRSDPTCVLAQPAPYQSFEHEVAFLEAHLGHLGGGGNAYVLGDALHGLRWHVYVASDGGWLAAVRRNAAADHSIEVCMTNLCPVKVGLCTRTFCRD
jgi:hypothetical protein